MASAREMRQHIQSVKSIAQVTRALETVSASHVRRATQAASATRPYAEKAWKLLIHLARQPGRNSLHPLLTEREEIKNVLVLMISGDRGLAGAYNVNILRETLQAFKNFSQPVAYIAVGRKGRDLLVRRRRSILAEFSNLPSPPSFLDTAAISRLVVDEYLQGHVDQVYIAFTEFVGMMQQVPVVRKLLPLEVKLASEDVRGYNVTHHETQAVFSYEPEQTEILNEIVPRYIEMQVYQSILSSQASEHAARMVAMRNATDNANELITGLVLEYNKARQQSITNDILDIAGGAEAQAQIGD